MSFGISFGINMSEHRALNKDISWIGSIDGVLRESTSIVNPDILFEGDITTIANANYMSIPAFGNRFYFIDNIESVRNNLYRIKAHVDVLETYKEQIKNCRGVVGRSATDYNRYLVDSKIASPNTRDIKTTKFGNSLEHEKIILVVSNV